MHGKRVNPAKPLNKTVSADLSVRLCGGKSIPSTLDVRQSFHGSEFLPLRGVDTASSDPQIVGLLRNADAFQTLESEKMSQNSTPASYVVSNWHHKATSLSSQLAIARHSSGAHDDENSLHSSEGCKGSSASSDSKTKSENQLSTYVTKDISKMSQRETLKVKKKHYRSEKKRATKELMSTLKDPAVIILADWLKVRGSLKSWTKLWCILKPGLIVLYKSPKAKSGHWVATILLNSCEVIERPSKKDGFCFKVFHPLDQSIWAAKGPKGENIGAIMQPLPYSYLIFRASSEAAGKCWMDALELALHCPALLARSLARDTSDVFSGAARSDCTSHVTAVRREMNETDREMHFKLCGLDEDMKTDDKEDKDDDKTETDSEEDEEEEEVKEIKPSASDDVLPVETPYVENKEEELGQQGDASQTEEVADENKSLIWTLVKQVRPGMDLSKVALPTFILEPRSFLDKLSDYYYHADILSEAVLDEDPFTRMKMVLKWYLSGFYKKPKGLKKPYNPILGEMFRCYWVHPKTGRRTFYIAEQICHHPPISAFYVTNRSDGFVVSGSILAKSKFYGNSLSAILDGVGQLTFLKRGEDYRFTMPYAHCKGILIGTLTMEFGGSVSVKCEKTGYHAELEFKLKPFLGSGEASNRVTGKIKLGEETLATIDGHWDQEVFITDKSKEVDSSDKIAELFWNPNPEVKSKRLKRWTVPTDSQSSFESETLWLHVSEAVLQSDQESATREKCLLEDEQRKATRERKLKMLDWEPRFFERNMITGHWIYKYADLRPWDPLNDVIQYEKNFVIQTKTRHQTPIVLTTSITNIEEKDAAGRSHSRHSSLESAMISRIKRLSIKRMHSIRGCESDSSTPEADPPAFDSESSLSAVETLLHEESSKGLSHVLRSKSNALERACAPILTLQKENSDQLAAIQQQIESLQRQFQLTRPNHDILMNQDLFKVIVIMLLQLVMFWWFK